MDPEIEVIHHRQPRTLRHTTNINSSEADFENESSQNLFSKNISFWHQFWALLLKDFTLQFRSYVTNICQLLVPIIFISFAGIIQVILNNLLHEKGVAAPGSDSLPIPLDVGYVINCNRSDTTTNAPDVCYDEAFNYLNSFDIDDLIAKIGPNNHLVKEIKNVTDTLRKNGTIPTQQVLFDLPYYYIGKDQSVKLPLGKESYDSETNGFEMCLLPNSLLFNFSLNFTINPNYKNTSFNEHLEDNGPYIQVPFFETLPIRNTTADLQAHLVTLVRNYNSLARTSTMSTDQYNRIYVVSPQSQKQYDNIMKKIQDEEFNEVKPQGGIYINSYDNTTDSVHLNYTIIANELTLLSVRTHSVIREFQNSTNTMELQRRNTLMNIVHNGILAWEQDCDGSIKPNDSAIVTYIMPLFSHKTNLTIDITILLGGILYPFAASFLFPVFIAALVKDKFERHLIMMEQNGLNRFTYWIITYIFNYTIYIFIAIVITVCSVLWQVRLFTQTSALLLIIIFWIWGHSQVVLGFFFANFFNGPRTATIIGYILVIAGILVAEVLEIFQIFPPDKTPFGLYMMYPPFAFYRLLFYLISACADYQCYDINILSSSNGLNLVTTSILYLTGSTILLMFASIYLSYVLPSEYGVRRSPFFPIIALYEFVKLLLKKCGLKTECKVKELSAPVLPIRSNSNSFDANEEIDEDIVQEENLIRNEFHSLDAPVIIFQLRKEYSGTGGKPSQVAVETFSLVVNRNECFGLLGPNGAGKTTLISVLTGLYEPTSGIAKIAGYDLATHMSDIHRHLGVCPQFDIQYPELTAEEHLLFYARLKGVKLGKAKRVVGNALKKVNLYDARNKKSKALSGGMRRRLSVAMACIGNPDILILDEPTTGLDPASRRQVWEVIERIKEERSVILTTHAMEEADHLCTRIGIMNYGRLRCLGSQNRLKAKFGTGYQLKFHCSPGRVNDVERFIQTNLSSVRHLETYADSCTYQMEKEDVIVSKLFELFDSVRSEIGIVDWGIKMTTLEDVFLNIVKNNSDTRNQLGTSYCPAWFPCQCNCYRTKSTDQ